MNLQKKVMNKIEINMNARKCVRLITDKLTDDKFILFWVIVNVVVVFMQTSGFSNLFLTIVDAFCTILFLAEMFVKITRNGVKGYLKSRWNWLDGFVTLLAVPSLIMIFFPSHWQDLSIFVVLRSLRLFKLFRASRLFPNIEQVWTGFRLALCQSKAILLGFVLMIVALGFVNYFFFNNAAPQYFATPMDSIYSVFRLFTIEGWYEIPDSVVTGLGWTWKPAVHLIRIYFCALLVGGGIIGMSLLNSIFVDAMVADNNDSVESKLDGIKNKLDEIEEKMKIQENK